MKNVHDNVTNLMNDKEKQQIITFKKFESANVWLFCLRNDSNNKF